MSGHTIATLVKCVLNLFRSRSFIQERTGLADDLKARRLGEEIDKCSLIFSQLAAVSRVEGAQSGRV